MRHKTIMVEREFEQDGIKFLFEAEYNFVPENNEAGAYIHIEYGPYSLHTWNELYSEWDVCTDRTLIDELYSVESGRMENMAYTQYCDWMAEQ